MSPISPLFEQAAFFPTWPIEYEEHFVHLLLEESLAGNLQGGMTTAIHHRLARESNKRTAGRFTVEMLEDEFLRLKSRYRYFDLVIEQEGYYWTPFGNIVINQVKNWEAFVKEYPFAAQYKEKGEPLWTELWSIFHNHFKFNSLGKAVIEESPAEKGNRSCPIVISDSEGSVSGLPLKTEDHNLDFFASEGNIHFCLQESVNNVDLNYFAPKHSASKQPKPIYEVIRTGASTSEKKITKIPVGSSSASWSFGFEEI